MIIDLLAVASEVAPANQGGTTAVVVAALTGGGICAIVASLVTGLFSKRKLGAEATEIITKAAAGVVSDLRIEVDRVTTARRTDQAEHERMMNEMAAAHAKERGEFMRVLQLHVAWDVMAIAKLGDLGITMPEAPPLTPARRYVDDSGHPL